MPQSPAIELLKAEAEYQAKILKAYADSINMEVIRREASGGDGNKSTLTIVLQDK